MPDSEKKVGAAMKKLSIVAASISFLIVGCSSEHCGKPVYRSPCQPVLELQSAVPDECGKPVYTAPHCLPNLKPFFDGIDQTVFGCEAK